MIARFARRVQRFERDGLSGRGQASPLAYYEVAQIRPYRVGARLALALTAYSRKQQRSRMRIKGGLTIGRLVDEGSRSEDREYAIKSVYAAGQTRYRLDAAVFSLYAGRLYRD